jgi:hypothetical protein
MKLGLPRIGAIETLSNNGIVISREVHGDSKTENLLRKGRKYDTGKEW